MGKKNIPHKETNIPVFQSASERFSVECHYLKGLILRYVRHYSARMLNERGACTPAKTSAWEVLDTTGIERNQAGSEFLDNAGFPQIEDISRQLSGVRSLIRYRAEATAASGRPDILMPEMIKKQFELDDMDMQILCAVAAPQVSFEITRLYRFASGLELPIFPVRFYCDLLSDPHGSREEILSRFSDESPLVRHALVLIGSQNELGKMTPRLHAPVTVPDRIANFLNGIMNKARIPYGNLVSVGNAKSFVSDEIRERFMVLAGRKDARIGLYGPSGSGRSLLIEESLETSRRGLVRINLSQIRSNETAASFGGIVRQWFSEARLQNAAIHFVCDGDMPNHVWELLTSFSDEIQALTETHNGPIFITASAPDHRIAQVFGKFAELVCPPPTQAQQPELWKHALSEILEPERIQDVVDYVASGYCLTPGEIDDVIKSTLARTGGMPSSLTGEQLSETIFAERGQGLSGLADLKATPLGLEDIVLSDEARNVIRNILNFARYSETVRDRWGFARMSSASGLSVLFSGPPGTGKTLTAGVIAHELRRALYVVDISRIVDKYIGETEKRLAKIFEHAQKSQAILLFDEADSLFAKRTEVKSSNDRYANLEVNYLLQKLEAYHGVTILTTNLASSLDEALARRIQFKLEFPMPDKRGRAELWRILIPKYAPHDDIDYERLASSFEMSGGHIKNAVFRACIQAAADNSPVDTEMLWDAGLHEYKELGHIVRDFDDDEYYPMH